MINGKTQRKHTQNQSLIKYSPNNQHHNINNREVARKRIETTRKMVKVHEVRAHLGTSWASPP